MPSNVSRPASTGSGFAIPLGPFAPAGIHDRCRPAQRAVLGRDAAARQPVSRASRRDGAARARLRSRSSSSTAARSSGRSTTLLVRDRAAGRRRDRPDPPAVRGGRSARRARPGHRRLQGRQRDRRRAQGRASLLFRRLPARTRCRARPSRTSRAPRRSFSRRSSRCIPQADGKPCVIGNCQAGWAVMMLAAMRPELFGPIIVAGSPLSYWAGVRGKNPMRYQRRPAGRQLADGAHQRSRRTASSTAPGWCRISRT